MRRCDQRLRPQDWNSKTISSRLANDSTRAASEPPACGLCTLRGGGEAGARQADSHAESSTSTTSSRTCRIAYHIIEGNK